MLNIARRGPSSVTKSLFSLSSTFSRCSTPIHTRGQHQWLSPSLPTVIKSFRSGGEWRRQREKRRQLFASSAVAEGEAVEGEIEHEAFSQTPPSDKQIKSAVRDDPVTKFKDLEDRGMVCKTVVNTITGVMGLETMTEVQSRTISQSLEGQDM